MEASWLVGILVGTLTEQLVAFAGTPAHDRQPRQGQVNLPVSARLLRWRVWAVSPCEGLGPLVQGPWPSLVSSMLWRVVGQGSVELVQPRSLRLLLKIVRPWAKESLSNPCSLGLLQQLVHRKDCTRQGQLRLQM